MIIGIIMGGLGNQLFQIFATIAYSIENKQRFIFPSEIQASVTQRHPYWDSFLTPLKIFTTIKIPQMNVLREKGFEYSAIPAISKDENRILYGYFQSYKYFERYYDTICRMIGLEEQKIQVQLRHPNNYMFMISMHFRLGDYMQLQDCYSILPYEYYRNSLQCIINTTLKDNWDVLFFCEKDDNTEVFATIDKLRSDFPNLKFLKQDDSVEDWKQMLMMSVCTHNIIANSSFSWWGAYFNYNPQKIVCYPEQWFGPKLRELNNTKDMFPDRWTKISCYL